MSNAIVTQRSMEHSATDKSISEVQYLNANLAHSSRHKHNLFPLNLSIFPTPIAAPLLQLYASPAAEAVNNKVSAEIRRPFLYIRFYIRSRERFTLRLWFFSRRRAATLYYFARCYIQFRGKVPIRSARYRELKCL